MPLANAPYSIRGKYIVSVGGRKGNQTSETGGVSAINHWQEQK